MCDRLRLLRLFEIRKKRKKSLFDLLWRMLDVFAYCFRGTRFEDDPREYGWFGLAKTGTVWSVSCSTCSL